MDVEPDDPPEEETQLHPLGSGRRSFKRRRVRIAWGDADGDHTFVLQERTLVGSATGAGLVLADATVSRLHAELVMVDGHLWIRDLGSRNGTFVEGILVDSARVPDQGRIRLGATELALLSDADTEDSELWPHPRFGPLIGASRVMRELFAQLARIAVTDSSAVIHGETGTGKELVARAIHEASRRSKKPFVVIDCAALPEHLLEAELFGHARGAFTGAVADRIGAFESADGGTMFLDEIGELPLTMQPKLLRVLESRTIRRVGESHHRPVDVRIISATHRDLRTMVNAGAFREDLYFRLAVLPLFVPPLRERRDDIPLLAQNFVGDQQQRLSDAFIAEIASRPWLGNVRELRNHVERALAFGEHRARAMSSVPPRAPHEPAPRLADGSDPHVVAEDFRTFREAWMERGERMYVERLLAAHGGVVAAAAAAAGLDRTYFYRLMRRLGIAPGGQR